MAEPTLDAKQKRALAAALLACPSMANRERRDAIIGELPAAIQHSITRSDAGLLDVFNTISATLNYPRGLTTLIDLVRLFEGHTLPMGEVERVLAEFEHTVPPVSPVPQPTRAFAPPGNVWVLETPMRMELVRIPAGQFLMGSDPGIDTNARADEYPPHPIDVAEFYIGRYPVTLAQYAAFARATGRKLEETQGRSNHPVTEVTWSDAVSFCRWLSQRSGRAFRLPTEAEWEKAARGTDGRLYPWGDDAPDATRGKFGRSFGQTTPVGQYPAGSSPYGVLDMAGNIWGWTASLYKPYPYRADDGRNDAQAEGPRALRGGSWGYDLRSARCAYRDSYSPGDLNVNIGFRVVVSLSSSDF